ncbi:MAG: 23S rRNA (pseudouridine(1915)-N(3))-methyltransferase RlmH [Bacteroidales bacterium]|jgi:23S rRNA (pseudouridine1915-N3)-methyltransferase|nr:23S rRNA (pseudouridine(1915)-N(3))-methyltransferase RlmH [Bacteroidales bacterium]
MKITLLAVGKTSQQFVKDGTEIYCERLKHYLPFQIKILPESKMTKNLPLKQLKEQQDEIILKSLQDGDCTVLLDERGKNMDSLNFAAFIEKRLSTCAKQLVFVSGGPFGCSQKIHDIATEKIALSQMTFSHQLVRLIFVEQLYRAMTIINHEPYHHV